MFIRKLKSLIKKLMNIYGRRKIKKYCYELSIKEILIKYKTNNEIYYYFHHHFYNLSPVWLKKHYEYFSKNNRAFGEPAFHAMWYKIFQEYKPINILEIGVYRGSTLSLFKLIADNNRYHAYVLGITPLNNSGDSVSKYPDAIDYLEDIKTNFRINNVEGIVIHKGYSTDSESIEKINENKWDLVFIDGNHEYKVVKEDFENASRNLAKDGIIVIDDSSLYSDYMPQSNSTKGHPGPSRLADEIKKNQFTEILQVGHNRAFQKI